MRDQPIMKPRHLVHPVTGDLMLFDVRSEAVCPTCGARYRRTLNVIALIRTKNELMQVSQRQTSRRVRRP